MLFSVVIALYNKADFIGATLEAAVSQSFTDFEVLVVDDGSTDDSASIVRQFDDPRIRMIRQANAGVAATRNAGIAEARGDWVAFLDADDLWRSDYLLTQAQTIALHPAVDVVGTGHYASKDLSKWSAVPIAGSIGARDVELIDDLPKRWLQSHLFFTSSVCVRTSRLRAMQPCFAVGESVGEDLDLWFRLGEIAPIAFVPARMVAYRLAVPGSLTVGRPHELLPPYLNRMRQRARSGELTAAQARSALTYIFHDQINVARYCIEIGKRGTAARWVARTAREGGSRARWWITLFMLAAPGAWVARFTQWRFRRGAIASAETHADPG